MKHLVDIVKGLLEFSAAVYMFPVGFILTGSYLTGGLPESGFLYAVVWVGMVLYASVE